MMFTPGSLFSRGWLAGTPRGGNFALPERSEGIAEKQPMRVGSVPEAGVRVRISLSAINRSVGAGSSAGTAGPGERTDRIRRQPKNVLLNLAAATALT